MSSQKLIVPFTTVVPVVHGVSNQFSEPQRTVSAQNLARELGYTTTSIGKFVKEGMPHYYEMETVRQKRRFVVEECRDWMKERGKI